MSLPNCSLFPPCEQLLSGWGCCGDGVSSVVSPSLLASPHCRCCGPSPVVVVVVLPPLSLLLLLLSCPHCCHCCPLVPIPGPSCCRVLGPSPVVGACAGITGGVILACRVACRRQLVITLPSTLQAGAHSGGIGWGSRVGPIVTR